MRNKSVLQLADEWIVGFLDRQQGQSFTVGEICRVAFQAGYRTRVNEKFEDTAEAYQQGKWMETNSLENSDSSDTPDLQEQIEALQQYMTVAQRKIMALQANVDLLIYLSRDKMGDEQALRRMDAVMKGFGRHNDEGI